MGNPNTRGIEVIRRLFIAVVSPHSQNEREPESKVVDPYPGGPAIEGNERLMGAASELCPEDWCLLTDAWKRSSGGHLHYEEEVLNRAIIDPVHNPPP